MFLGLNSPHLTNPLLALRHLKPPQGVSTFSQLAAMVLSFRPMITITLPFSLYELYVSRWSLVSPPPPPLFFFF